MTDDYRDRLILIIIVIRATNLSVRHKLILNIKLSIKFAKINNFILCIEINCRINCDIVAYS